ncbi:MAG: hypothetical protein KGJ78_01950 [Alphaproteobacteria bacterium]|nr:hypothetical protein [Alphaproteobacteria bacterium]
MTTVTLIIVLRAVHVLAGVVWAGAMFTLVATGPLVAGKTSAADAILAVRAKQKRIAMVTGIAALLTVAAGMALYGMLHSGPQSTGDHILGVAALIAILSFPVAGIIGGPANRKLGRLALLLQSEKREPSAGEARVVDALMARSTLATKIAAALLAIAVLGMATWRYF